MKFETWMTQKFGKRCPHCGNRLPLHFNIIYYLPDHVFHCDHCDTPLKISRRRRAIIAIILFIGAVTIFISFLPKFPTYVFQPGMAEALLPLYVIFAWFVFYYFDTIEIVHDRVVVREKTTGKVRYLRPDDWKDLNENLTADHYEVEGFI